MSHENPNKEIIVAHVPVIHAGYLDLFDRHSDADIGVLGEDVLQHFSYLRKEIRALSPDQAVTILRGMGRNALTMTGDGLTHAPERYDTVIMPSDDISRTLAAEHLEAVTFEPVFLRWDRDNTKVNVAVVPDETVAAADLPEDLIDTVMQEADESSSWWRQVGAVLLDNEGNVISRGHNGSLPTEYSNWIDGDPRNTAKRGQAIDLSIDIHAEARLIAHAAREGVSLKGGSICVSTFPCPNCAKLIAESGIEKCYFVEGYAMLDGHSVLKNADITIVKIEVEAPNNPDLRALRPYPSS